MQKLNITGLTRAEVTIAHLADHQPETGWVRQVWLLPLVALILGTMTVVSGLMGINFGIVIATLVVVSAIVGADVRRRLRVDFARKNVSKVIAVRDGLQRIVPVDQVVPGDVLVTRHKDVLPFMVQNTRHLKVIPAGELVGTSVVRVCAPTMTANVMTINGFVDVLLRIALRTASFVFATVGEVSLDVRHWVVTQAQRVQQLVTVTGWQLVQRLIGRLILFGRESAFRYNQGPVQQSLVGH